MSIRSLVLAVLFAVGCGDSALPAAVDGGPDLTPPGPDMTHFARPALGTPITAPMSEWTWVDFPDSTCNEGTPTGIGVGLTASKNLLVFLTGGGACWDYDTCFNLGTAATGPFTATQFTKEILPATADGSGTLFDRSDEKNPFRDWNLVYIPYCTGDVHAGDNDAMYTKGGDVKTWRHRGRPNVQAFLARIAATIPEPERAVLSGSSAGGFGAAFNYDLFRQYFPDGKTYLLDDSGPPLIGDEIPPGFVKEWYANWRIDKILGPLCPECQTDLSGLVSALGEKYPGDRAALLSSLQDKTIGGYFLKSGPQFQADLYDVATTVIDPLPDFRYFFVPGTTHTMLGDPARFKTTDGVALQSWITQMVTDDPAWSSHKP